MSGYKYTLDKDFVALFNGKMEISTSSEIKLDEIKEPDIMSGERWQNIISGSMKF
jgi:hypothetical protein